MACRPSHLVRLGSVGTGQHQRLALVGMRTVPGQSSEQTKLGARHLLPEKSEGKARTLLFSGEQLQHHLLSSSQCRDSLFAGQCRQGTGVLEEPGVTDTNLPGSSSHWLRACALPLPQAVQISAVDLSQLD